MAGRSVCKQCLVFLSMQSKQSKQVCQECGVKLFKSEKDGMYLCDKCFIVSQEQE